MGLTAENMGAAASGKASRAAAREHQPVIALMGNPNVGKSTVFNQLTGMNQHTGNWPGKTVSMAQGQFTYKGTQYLLADLPGTYSLLGRSAEEMVAVDFITAGQADCVVVVCDGTCLERNLNLVLQVMALTARIVVCVNLLDEAEKKHICIDLPRLEQQLGVPVIGTAAGSGRGLGKLQETLREVIDGFKPIHPRCVQLPAGASLAGATAAQSDQIAAAMVHRAEEIAAQVTEGGCGYACRERRIDRILTGKWTALPAMLLLLVLVFWLTIEGANYPSQLLQTGFDKLGAVFVRGMQALHAPWWLQGALIDGVWATVARVVAVMLPPMAIFFPLFTLLEDLGYLPRVAYVLDKQFAKCGACGKQSLSMCSGFGCNAAGVVGCRIIDSPRERLIAILTNSFVPCNGRFPALITLILIFFAGSGGIGSSLMLTGLVLLGVVMTFVVSWVLSKTILKGVPSFFTLELPPFRKPRIGEVIVRSLLDRTLFVLGRAVVVAAPAGLLIWGVANIHVGDTTVLVGLAGFMEPFGAFFGLSGAILLAFLLGFPANELVVPILLMIVGAGAAFGGDVTNSAAASLLTAAGWTWKTALCTMVFCLFHWPCSTTCLTVYRETKSVKWTLAAFALPTLVGLLLCLLLRVGLSLI